MSVLTSIVVWGSPVVAALSIVAGFMMVVSLVRQGSGSSLATGRRRDVVRMPEESVESRVPVATLATAATQLEVLRARFELMWNLYVEDALIHQFREGLLERRSPPSNTPAYVEANRSRFDHVSSGLLFSIAEKNTAKLPEEGDLATEVMRALGWPMLRARAEALELTVSGYLAHAIAVVHEMHKAIREGTVEKLPYPLQ